MENQTNDSTVTETASETDQHRGRPSTYSKEVIAKAIEALQAGGKVKEVAALTGMSATSVTYYKHKLMPSKPRKAASQEEQLVSHLDEQVKEISEEIAELEASLVAARARLLDVSSKRERVAAALGL